MRMREFIINRLLPRWIQRTSNLLAGKLFKIPVKETHTHARIIIRLSLPRWIRRNF
jgi:hypothetical protein